MGRPTKDPKQSIPKHTKALVWKHFSDNEDGQTVRCLLCSPKIVNMRIKDASTKSPRSHLASFHNKEWKEMEKEEMEKEKQAEKEKATNSAEKMSQPKIKLDGVGPVDNRPSND